MSKPSNTTTPSGRPVETSYDGTGRAFHWIVAGLLVCQYVTACLLPHIKLDTPLDTMINLHFNLGLIIMAVMAARLVHRWRHPVRVASGEGARWERFLANAVHVLFYAILLGAPFLGWSAASAHGVPVKMLGLVELPALASRKARWAFEAGDVHGYAMWTLLAIIALHAAAALYHHFIRRDQVLSRMLPITARSR